MTETVEQVSQSNGESRLEALADRAPDMWSIVEHHRRACLDYPGGPGYRRLIVEYEVRRDTLSLALPPGEMIGDALDHEVLTLEILDEYLAPTSEHVWLVGRAEVSDASGRGGAPQAAPRWTRLPSRTVLVTPVSLARGEY